MGCCLSAGINPLQEITISIFGLQNAGKTCLLRSLLGNFDFNTNPTTELDQQKITYRKGLTLKVYDFGGSSEARSDWSSSFLAINGFLYVIDASDSSHFQESKNTLDQILSNKRMQNKPCVILANKQDNPSALAAEDLRSYLDINKAISIYDATITSSTAEKLNEGITQAIDTLITKIVANSIDVSDNNGKVSQSNLSSLEKDLETFEQEYQTCEQFSEDPHYTKLHYAAEKANDSIGEYLISTGADVNAKDIFYQNIRKHYFESICFKIHKEN